MNVRFTDSAKADFRKIASQSKIAYPDITPVLINRLEQVLTRLALWPQSGKAVHGRQGVCATPVGHFPFILFYRVLEDTVEVLHIRHTARKPWNPHR